MIHLEQRLSTFSVRKDYMLMLLFARGLIQHKAVEQRLNIADLEKE